ncbi:MAG: hypothetical protein E7673_06070 [Ruminococcaceae bacterium]|nr:hypothetical protein [Oscillospiraceae bacterium]
MEKYGVFDINNVSISNLGSIAKEEGRSFELRLCEISFMAESISRQIRSLIEEEMTVFEALALLKEEVCFDEYEPSVDVINETVNGVKSFLRTLTASDKANFSSLLREKLWLNGVEINEGAFLPESFQNETFVYVKSALADEAFDVFSQEFLDPRVAYAESFKEACVSVADKRYGYCILPFEEKQSVRIPSIEKLVSDLDLKILAITPVFGFEGNADMKYALISRDFRIPDRDEATDRYFEMVIPKSSMRLTELLSAAEIFGVDVYRIGTSFLGEDNGRTLYSIVFKDGGESFTDLFIYLSLFVDEYVPFGIYKNIE